MNRFLVSSAIIGAGLGIGHGRTSRASSSQSVPMEAMFCVRDLVIGAVAYPFMLPIGVYQIATHQEDKGCMFQALFHSHQKKSVPNEETSLK